MPGKVKLAEHLAVDAKIIYREIVGEGKCPKYSYCEILKGIDEKRCNACREKACSSIAGILEKNIRRIVKEALA